MKQSYVIAGTHQIAESLRKDGKVPKEAIYAHHPYQLRGVREVDIYVHHSYRWLPQDLVYEVHFLEETGLANVVRLK